MFLFGLPLSMENFILFSPLGLSIAPPLAFLSFFYLPFFKDSLFISSLARIAIFLFVYAITFSLVILLYSLCFKNSGSKLFLSFSQQAVSLTLGLLCFFVLRGFFFYFGYKAVTWIILGSIPTVIICFIQFSSYLLGVYEGVKIVDQLRLAILGSQISHHLGYRVSGFTAEPSHLGAYLVLVLVPAIFLVLNIDGLTRMKKRLLKGLLVCVLICVLFTVSGTTMLIALTMVVVHFAISNDYSFKQFILFIGLSVGVITAVFLVPGNYILHQYENLAAGGLSWVGKYGSSIGPLYMMSETGNLFGYGLGGTQSNIEKLLPEEWREFLLLMEKQRTDFEDMRVKTLIGRILAEIGLIGFIIFTAFLTKAMSMLMGNKRGEKIILIPTIVGVFVAAFSGNIGSFTHPFLWLWPAFIDGINQRDSIR